MKKDTHKTKARITTLREHMYQLIRRKRNLLDPEIIQSSQNLDKVLNEYNQIEEEKAMDKNTKKE